MDENSLPRGRRRQEAIRLAGEVLKRHSAFELCREALFLLKEGSSKYNFAAVVAQNITAAMACAERRHTDERVFKEWQYHASRLRASLAELDKLLISEEDGDCCLVFIFLQQAVKDVLEY